MNPLQKLIRPGIVVALVLGAMMLSGCAQNVYLKSNPVEPARIVETDAANKIYNAARFESFGPYMQQIYGYFLYDEGADVVVNGTGLVKLGKMNLKEAVADYDRTRTKTGWSKASPPIIKEVFGDGKLIGYTLSDFMLDVNIWEDQKASKEANKVIYRIYYQDRRKLEGDGGGKEGKERR